MAYDAWLTHNLKGTHKYIIISSWNEGYNIDTSQISLEIPQIKEKVSDETFWLKIKRFKLIQIIWY